MWIHNGVMYFCAVDSGNSQELTKMEYSKWRCCSDFVKLSRCINISQSLSIQLRFLFLFYFFCFYKELLLTLCSSSEQAGILCKILLRERQDQLQISKKDCQSNAGEMGIHFAMLHVKCLSDIRKSLSAWQHACRTKYQENQIIFRNFFNYNVLHMLLYP